eukprot:c7449_g1_i1.p1 GENE.c7449_g1_i1~~c7449_g1_i1.p1  ORF type:complete len:174 (-),score=48.59 c7449_g1_i1:37-513(-)
MKCLVVVGLLCVLCAQAVPFASLQSAVTISLPEPRRLVQDASVRWVDVLPTKGSLVDQNLLQLDEAGSDVAVSAPAAISCNIDSGCTCKHHYYFKHLDVQGCQVFVPEQYHKNAFRCQYFVQGGYLFLYGNSWKKSESPSTGASAMSGDTYFCSADPE